MIYILRLVLVNLLTPLDTTVLFALNICLAEHLVGGFIETTVQTVLVMTPFRILFRGGLHAQGSDGDPL